MIGWGGGGGGEGGTLAQLGQAGEGYADEDGDDVDGSGEEDDGAAGGEVGAVTQGQAARGEDGTQESRDHHHLGQGPGEEPAHGHRKGQEGDH